MFVYLEGQPTFDGGGCPSRWAGSFLDDAKFRQFVWPLLMTAKTTKEDILITVNGCIGAVPKIEWVDLLPRE